MNEQEKQTKKRHRSPSYPAISLKDAIEKAQVIWDKEKQHSVPAMVVIKHWDYTEKSSGGKLALSALLKYGLLEEVESSTGREVKLTKLALKILVGEEADRKAALKESALTPKIYSELWQKYGANLPSEESLKSKLILEQNFNTTAIPSFIKDYKDTISFTGLEDSDKVRTDEEIDPNKPETDELKKSNDPLKPKTRETPLTRNGGGGSVLATYSIPLGANEATLTFTGKTALQPEDFEELKDALEFFKKQYERKLKQDQNALSGFFGASSSQKSEEPK